MSTAPNFVQISSKLLAPRLPELGHIKIGGKGELRKSRGGKEFRLPVKYDHFVVTRRDRDGKTENLVRDDRIHQAIGEVPKELDVRLLFDRPQQNFQYFLAAYDGRSKRCSGNGEVAHDREHGDIPCTCPWFTKHEGAYAGPKRPVGKNTPTCKPHGRLSVILEAAESFGGFYVFRTTSWETISSIAAQLDVFLAQFGFLSGLPLRMVVYPATDTYEEDGQTKTSTSYKVALVLRGSFDTARQIAASAYERREQLALPSPAQAVVHQQQLLEEEERDAEEISAEFHPETYAEVVDAVVVEADSPEDLARERYVEDLIRTTLEAADWTPERVNEQIAKYSDNLEALLALLRERVPGRVQMAEELLEQERQQSAAPGDGEICEGCDHMVTDCQCPGADPLDDLSEQGALL